MLRCYFITLSWTALEPTENCLLTFVPIDSSARLSTLLSGLLFSPIGHRSPGDPFEPPLDLSGNYELLFPSINSTCSLLTAHLLFFPSNLMYILAPAGNIKEGLLQHDGYSSRQNYIITSRNKYDVSSVTNRELNSELSVGGLNSWLNIGTRLSKEHFWQIEFLNKQAFVPTEERLAICKILWSCIQGVLPVPGGSSMHRLEQIGVAS